MERIELRENQGKWESMVYYKLVGCRTLYSRSAIELNKSAVFTLFKSDHAQMIVSIATAEILIGIPIEEVNNKYKKYISHCNLKLNGKIHIIFFKIFRPMTSIVKISVITNMNIAGFNKIF
jgi:hypothetical protein